MQHSNLYTSTSNPMDLGILLIGTASFRNLSCFFAFYAIPKSPIFFCENFLLLVIIDMPEQRGEKSVDIHLCWHTCTQLQQ